MPPVGPLPKRFTVNINSSQWDVEGWTLNIELTNVSQTSLQTVEKELCMNPTSRVAWKLQATADRGGLYMLLDFDQSPEDQRPAHVSAEAALPNTWLLPRSGRKFVRKFGPFDSVIGLFSIRLKTLERACFVDEDTLRLQIRLRASPTQREQFSCTPLQLGCILDSGEHSDMAFVANGKEFKVHRAILAARSPVLKRMISANMSESTSGRVEVTDLEAGIAAAFLQYLYCGSCDGPAFNIADIIGMRWHELMNFAGIDDVRDLLTSFLITCDSGWCEINQTNGDLHITSSYGDEAKLERVGDGRWKFGGNDLLWKDCSLKLYQSHEEMWLTMFSKAAEARFADFWGRLLCTADKYCVDELAAMCEDRLLERLSVWSAAPMLQYACMTSRPSLKKDIIRFITLDSEILQGVQDTQEYDSLGQHLQNEVTEAFVAKLVRSKRRRPEQEEALEFARGEDWRRLSCAQLRRACAERGLDTGGHHAALVSRLCAQEPVVQPASG